MSHSGNEEEDEDHASEEEDQIVEPSFAAPKFSNNVVPRTSTGETGRGSFELDIRSRSSKLGALVSNRPSAAALQKLGILQPAVSQELTKAQAKAVLAAKLSARPTKEALLNSNIMRHAKSGSLDASREDKRKALGSFLMARPSADKLVQAKVLADIGALPSHDTKAYLTGAEVVPRLLSKLTAKAVQVVCGFAHTCVLDAEGCVWSFGRADRTGFGVPAADTVLDSYCMPRVLETPRKLVGAVTAVSAGDNHTALIAGGVVYSWGQGAWGRLGLGHELDAYVPTPVALPEEAVALSCGSYHSVVVVASGRAFSFGWNKTGALGCGEDPFTSLEPVQVGLFGLDEAAPRMASCSASQGYTMAVTTEGQLYSWGHNTWGQLGVGSVANCYEPTLVTAFEGARVQSYSTGHTHALAVAGGKLYAWGLGKHHQLGVAAAATATPVEVTQEGLEIAPSSLVSAGQDTSFATDAKGGLWAWGSQSGGRGMLGVGAAEEALPRLVERLADKAVVAVSAGWAHSAACTADGGVYTWGTRQYGKLGHGSH